MCAAFRQLQHNLNFAGYGPGLRRARQEALAQRDDHGVRLSPVDTSPRRSSRGAGRPR